MVTIESLKDKKLNESLNLFKEAYELHDTLNPKLFDLETNKLKPEVLEKLSGIFEEFLKSIDPLTLSIVDVRLVGSNASYNYNDQSDIDLHLLVNFDLNYINDEILQSIYNDKKNKFNEKYDFEIYGIPVEIYIEDMKSINATNGIYSILKNEWVREPVPMKYELPDYSTELAETRAKINEVLQSNDSKLIEDTINAIYLMRKDGLAIDGEMSIGNLVFKELRNDGLLDGLRNKYCELISDELSLNESVLNEDSSFDDYNDRVNQYRDKIEKELINTLKSEFPNAKVSNVIHSKYSGDRIRMTFKELIVTVILMELLDTESGEPEYALSYDGGQRYIGTSKQVVDFIKNYIVKDYKLTEDYRNEENYQKIAKQIQSIRVKIKELKNNLDYDNLYPSSEKMRIACDFSEEDWKDMNYYEKQSMYDLFCSDKDEKVKKHNDTMKQINELENQEEQLESKLDKLEQKEFERQGGNTYKYDLPDEFSGTSAKGFKLDTGDIKQDFVKNPEYAKSKGYNGCYIAKMTPDEYMDRCSKQIFKEPIENVYSGMEDKNNVKKYAELMKNGEKFDMPWIDVKTQNQEGRHRALAAKEIGIKEIPVLYLY